MAALLETARRLRARSKGGRTGGAGLVPALIFVTDPARTPDLDAILERLPRGAGVIYRAFGAPDAVETGLRLRRIAARRGLVLLVGADPALARAVRADGVHLPQRLAGQAGRLARSRPGWIVTAAAHSRSAAIAAERGGAQAILLSSVFDSASPSAGSALGVVRFAAMTRGLKAPVIALGGVTAFTARRLLGTRASGLAAVGAFSS